MSPPDPTGSGALLDELATLLRPPGLGVHAVSTGRAAILVASQRYLQGTTSEQSGHQPLSSSASATSSALDGSPSADVVRTQSAETSPEQVLASLQESWRSGLRQLLDPAHKVAMLAIPSDTGAGIVRGAMHGPQAIRLQLGRAPVLDLGDVFCVPMLLDDEMCSETALERAREALYPDVAPPLRSSLPVSPIGIARRAVQIIRLLRPSLRLMVLGGDHTVTWPVIDALFPGPDTNPQRASLGARSPEQLDSEAREHAARSYADLGIVHFDAHTDLLPHRLGIRYCFATWAWHANQRIGGGQRLLQLGIRASGREQAHWESTLDVRQVWARDALKMTPQALAQLVVEHLLARGVRRVYLSNDLDGTDAHWAAACGTPEPGGLTPDQILAVIESLRSFDVIGADLVELAPGLSLDRDAARRSVETASAYVRASVELLKQATYRPAT